MRAVIMAGGEGQRLRPFTHSIPKPLLPIGRKPVAQIIVERLKECGFTDVVFSLGYGADLIRAFFREGEQFGLRITYFQEPTKLGTAGCLAHIPRLTEQPFLVTNGDILTDLDYSELLAKHASSGAALTVATRLDKFVVPYGVVKLDGENVQSVEEKPSIPYAFSAGIYALAPQAVGHVPSEGICDMTDLIGRLLESGMAVKAHEFDGLWFDLARVDDFEKALARLESVRPDLL